MSFFQGRATFLRFRVSGATPSAFSVPALDSLRANMIGRQKLASADGVETGWIAGADILDTAFEMEKNVVDDALFFALRIDSNKLPADLLKAYYQADLRALIAGNPSGKPSARQKREAKESARDRLEHEAKDGRFLKRKAIECLWDRNTNELLFGATSMAQVDRLGVLFKATFGGDIEARTATRNAFGNGLHEINGLTLSKFVANGPDDAAWVLDQNSRDFLGNEFLLWMWWYTENRNDTVKLPDKTEVTIMPASALSLDCPHGTQGNDTFRHDVPVRLPEARRAIASGKLPRRMGLVMVRGGEQFTLSLLAETMAIGSAALPKPTEDGEQARRVERLGRVDYMLETLDLLYAVFCHERLTVTRWAVVLSDMRGWLANGAKKEAA